MSTRRELLALRRQKLIVDAAVQRVEIAYFTERLAGPIAVADGALSAISAARRHPLVVAAVIGFLFAVSRKRVVRMAGRGWGLWRLYRMFSGKRARSAIAVLVSRFAGGLG